MSKSIQLKYTIDRMQSINILEQEGRPDLAVLPNGLEVAFQTRAELLHFYRDIFEEEVYLGGGLRLGPRAVVFDVGANIGLFTLFATTRSPGAQIWAFEPAPPLFALLQDNASRYAPAARLFNLGVADRSGTAEILFYPESSGMSSFHANQQEEREALRTVVENEAREGDEAARRILEGQLEEYLDERLKGTSFPCRLTTMSEVIASERMESIDLLKIDVQKSEMAVLQGLREEDWPKVRQLAVEVHDLDGRVERLRQRLEEVGYTVEIEQDPLYEGSDIYLLYGRQRRSTPRTLAALEDHRPRSLLVWSADDPQTLQSHTDALERHLTASSAVDDVTAPSLAALAATLQRTRPAQLHRRCAVVGEDPGEASQIVIGREPARRFEGVAAAAQAPDIAFLFPGLGNHHPAMAADLLRTEAGFRRDVLECCEMLTPVLGTDLTQHFEGLSRRSAGSSAGSSPRTGGPDLRRMLRLAGATGDQDGAGPLRETHLAQPALFILELALARLWIRWGIRPGALLGYSLGELVAACLAGVFERETVLRLVAERARQIADLPKGAMLAVSLSAEALHHRLGEALSLTAEIGPFAAVVGGPCEAVAELERQLVAEDVVYQRLETTHAFHSEMLRPAVVPFTAAVAAVPRQPPAIPWLSNVTGTWITPQQATDPEYWGSHIVRPVRFAAALEELWSANQRAVLEIGPGGTLGAWALQHPASQTHQGIPLVLSSLPHPFDGHQDHDVRLRTLGTLWAHGAEVDWDAFHGDRQRRLVALPPEVLENVADDAIAAQVRPAEEAFGPLETDLSALWCQVLDRPTVGRHDNFFEIGGDSLRAFRLITACEESFGVHLTLRQLFDASTIAQLATLLDSETNPASVG